MDLDTRISQFKNMTEADPQNALGHFSLGKAYLEADRLAEAELALRRVLEIDPDYSRAYLLLGDVQRRQNKKSDAAATLKRGHAVSAKRGDIQPRDEIAKLLTDMGETVPRVETVTTAAPSRAAGDASGFQCKRCGRPGGKLPERPFKGELGEKVFAHICSDCWREWIGMGTKVINELGLPLADPRAQETYDQYMVEFLQLEDA